MTRLSNEVRRVKQAVRSASSGSKRRRPRRQPLAVRVAQSAAETTLRTRPRRSAIRSNASSRASSLASRASTRSRRTRRLRDRRSVRSRRRRLARVRHTDVRAAEVALAGTLPSVRAMDPPVGSGFSRQISSRMTSQVQFSVQPGTYRIVAVNPYTPGGGYYTDPIPSTGAVNKVSTFPLRYARTARNLCNSASVSNAPVGALPFASADMYDANPVAFWTTQTNNQADLNYYQWNAIPVTQPAFDTKQRANMPVQRLTLTAGTTTPGYYGSAQYAVAPGNCEDDTFEFQTCQFLGGIMNVEVAIPYQAQGKVTIMDLHADKRVHTSEAKQTVAGDYPLNSVILRQQPWMTDRFNDLAGRFDLRAAIQNGYAPQFLQGGTDTGCWNFSSTTPALAGATTFKAGSCKYAVPPAVNDFSPNADLLPTDVTSSYAMMRYLQHNRYGVMMAAGTNYSANSTANYTQAVAASPPFCNLLFGPIEPESVPVNEEQGWFYNSGNPSGPASNTNQDKFEEISYEVRSWFDVPGFFQTCTHFYLLENTGTGDMMVSLKNKNDYGLIVDPSLAVANLASPQLGYTPTDPPRHVGHSASGPTPAAAQSAVIAKAAAACEHAHPASTGIIHSAIEKVAGAVDDLTGGNMVTSGAKILENIIDPSQAVTVVADKVAEHLPGPVGELAKTIIGGVQEASVENIVSDIVSDPVSAVGDFFSDLFG